MTRTFVLDVVERAVKTFLQAFLAVLVTSWAASGLSVDLLDLSAWQKVLTAGAAAGLAAVVSAGTSLLSGVRTGTASASREVAMTVAGQPGVVTDLPVDLQSAVLAEYDPRHDVAHDAGDLVLDGTGGV